MATPDINPVTTMTLLGLLKQNVKYYGEGHEKQGELVNNRANKNTYNTYQTAMDNILKQFGGAEKFEQSYFKAKGAEPLPKAVASMAADSVDKATLPPLPPRRPDSLPSFVEAGQSGKAEGAGGPFTLQKQAEPSETRKAFSLPPRRESLLTTQEPDGPKQLFPSQLSEREPDGPKQLIPRSVEANKVRLPPRRPDDLMESTSAPVSTNEQGYKVYKKDSTEAQSFRDAYAVAKEGAVFEWDGREYKKY